MKTVLGIGVACLIALAMVTSFSDALGVDYWFPGFDTWKTTYVGVVFLLIAIGGLLHQIHKRKSDD
jgi:hypothetical protein